MPSLSAASVADIKVATTARTIPKHIVREVVTLEWAQINLKGRVRRCLAFTC